MTVTPYDECHYVLFLFLLSNRIFFFNCIEIGLHFLIWYSYYKRFSKIVEKQNSNFYANWLALSFQNVYSMLCVPNIVDFYPFHFMLLQAKKILKNCMITQRIASKSMRWHLFNVYTDFVYLLYIYGFATFENGLRF